MLRPSGEKSCACCKCEYFDATKLNFTTSVKKCDRKYYWCYGGEYSDVVQVIMGISKVWQ